MATAATGVALTPGARHVVAHAAAVPGEGLLRLGGADHSQLDRLRRARLRQMRPQLEARARAIRDSRPVRLVVGPGRPEDPIADLTARIGADLVVTGTRQRAGQRQALLGSIGRHTIRQAPCDVLIAHTPDRAQPRAAMHPSVSADCSRSAREAEAPLMVWSSWPKRIDAL